VRSDLRTTYQFSPDDPMRSLTELTSDELLAYQVERVPHWIADPLNPRSFSMTPGIASSILELPDAPAQPYLAQREGVPEGTIVREDIERDPLGAGRRTWTYLPPGYDAAKGPYPLVLFFDGWGGRKLGVHTTLDNMIADGVIPPAVCVMVHQLDRMTELACNDTFTDWLATDFVPSWVRKRYAVTDAPARTVVSGMSLGGLAAAHCALRHPEVFGNVLSQSGSYWWGGESLGTHAWLTREYEARERLPVRWYMDVGLLEDMRRSGDVPVMLDANRELRDVLQAKGYDVRYSEYNGGHDQVCWRGTFGDGLACLLGE
jgi:enterochelin esterase family protein